MRSKSDFPTVLLGGCDCEELKREGALGGEAAFAADWGKRLVEPAAGGAEVPPRKLLPAYVSQQKLP